MVQAFILIQTEVGKAATVAQSIGELSGVVSAEDVTGPYDVIARVEAGTVDELGRKSRGSLARSPAPWSTSERPLMLPGTAADRIGMRCERMPCERLRPGGGNAASGMRPRRRGGRSR